MRVWLSRGNSPHLPRTLTQRWSPDLAGPWEKEMALVWHLRSPPYFLWRAWIRTHSSAAPLGAAPPGSGPPWLSWETKTRYESSVQFSRSVVSDSLRPQELQHTRPPCPSTTPRVHPNPCPLSRWCHPTISSSVVPFSSCPQSFAASGSFPMSQLFASGDQSTGVSASTSDLPMNTQDWSPLGWTGWILVFSWTKNLSKYKSITITTSVSWVCYYLPGIP